MSSRVNISEEMKVSLLRETNYRCGYCMTNITPRSYCYQTRNNTLNSSEKTEPVKYYQTYDVAHIEPYDENDPLTNNFENLIAMCKSCHLESEPRHGENSSIPKSTLYDLKLYLMISSGRYSRVEMELLKDLYSYDEQKPLEWVEIGSFFTDSAININIPCVLVTFRNLIFFRNIIKRNLVQSLENKKNRPKGNTLAAFATNVIRNPLPFEDSTNLVLTTEGAKFCKKFFS